MQHKIYFYCHIEISFFLAFLYFVHLYGGVYEFVCHGEQKKKIRYQTENTVQIYAILSTNLCAHVVYKTSCLYINEAKNRRTNELNFELLYSWSMAAPVNVD